MKVKYTFEVTKDVPISMAEKPDNYSEEEWEDQLIQNVGDQLEFALEGSISWYFRKL